MNLLESEPHIAPGLAGDPDVGRLPDVVANDGPIADDLLAPRAGDVAVDVMPAGATCPSCGAGVAGGQEWCLECGSAVKPPRTLPGLRAIAAAGVLSLVLAGGAVAASYAALNDSPPAQQTKVQIVAQVTPAPVVEEVVPPAETTPAPVEPDPLPPVDVAPAPVEPIAPAPVPDPTPEPTPDTTPTPPANPQVLPPVGAGSLYDPLAHATSSGDPLRALDAGTRTPRGS